MIKYIVGFLGLFEFIAAGLYLTLPDPTEGNPLLPYNFGQVNKPLTFFFFFLRLNLFLFSFSFSFSSFFFFFFSGPCHCRPLGDFYPYSWSPKAHLCHNSTNTRSFFFLISFFLFLSSPSPSLNPCPGLFPPSLFPSFLLQTLTHPFPGSHFSLILTHIIETIMWWNFALSPNYNTNNLPLPELALKIFRDAPSTEFVMLFGLPFLVAFFILFGGPSSK